MSEHQSLSLPLPNENLACSTCVYTFFICFDFQTLSLRNGKNTFSNLLKGKLLILENIQQLVMTAFTAGFPSVTTEDDVVSEINIFRML